MLLCLAIFPAEDLSSNRFHLARSILQGFPSQGQGHENVLFGSKHRQQIEALEDETDLMAAQQGELVVVHAGQILAVEHDVSASGRIKSGQRVHQRGFARAGGAHDDGEFSLFEGDIDVT